MTAVTAKTFDECVAALQQCESFLRSVNAVASRNGEGTNWVALSKAARKYLAQVQKVMKKIPVNTIP
jgi:hypothetical protein